MRFQVPQFIDIEDKVFGPFTFKQFVYIAGAIGLSFVLLRLLPRFFAVIAIIPVALFALALAFNLYKPTGRPFIQLVEAFMRYTFGPRLYVWKHSEKEVERKPFLPESYRQLEVPKTGKSRLKDLTWMLDARKGEEGKADSV